METDHFLSDGSSKSLGMFPTEEPGLGHVTTPDPISVVAGGGPCLDSPVKCLLR